MGFRFLLATAVWCSWGWAALVQAERIAIIVPPDADQPTQFAAQELQRYLQKITGQQIAIGPETPPEAALLRVGDSSAALKATLGEEGYVLRPAPGGLLLAGGSGRGTVYAVYDFLERLGCRWYYPGEQDELVPALSLADLSKFIHAGLNIEEKPAFSVRMPQYLIYDLGPDGTPFSDAIMGTLPAIADWMAKNRLNVFQFAIDHTPVCYTHWPHFRSLIPELRKRGISPAMAGHCMFLFLSEDDFKAHPDWRPMVKGKRVEHGQFCTRNEDAVRHYIDNLIRFLRENPEIEYFAPWPNDLGGWCECPQCKDTPSADRHMQLGNRIFQELKQAAPHVRYTHFAYGSHMKPPEKERLAPGLTMTLCTHSRDLAVPFYDRRTRPEFRQAYEQWRNMCRQDQAPFVFHEKYARLWGVFGLHPLPLPILQPDLRWFRDQGIDGFELPIGYMGWRTKSFNLHVLARLMWNPDADVPAIIDDYFQRFYGKAGKLMGQAYAEVEKAQPCLQYWSGNPIKTLPNHPVGQPYPPEIQAYAPNAVKHLELAQEYVRTALPQTEDEAIRGRVRRFGESLDYLHLEWAVVNKIIDADRLIKEAGASAKEQDRHRSLEAARQLLLSARRLSDRREELARTNLAEGLYWDVIGGRPSDIFRPRQIDGWLKLLDGKTPSTKTGNAN